MSKRKFVRQENLKDCGAACLLMIMKYYGGNYPLEQLREMMKIDKNGTTALNLIKAAQSVGFDARGYKYNDLDDLKCPLIAHVILNKTYHHFIVVQKINYKTKTLTIADPALGIKKYSFDEFKTIWTNNIISLYPIRKIDNINTIKKARQTILQIINPYKKIFIYIFILSIVYTILNILNTYYFKIIIDHSYTSKTIYLYLFLFFLSMSFIKIMIDYIRNKLLIYIDQRIDKSLMETTFKHLLALPWQYFNSRATGEIISRLNDLGYVRELISKTAVILLIDLVLVIGSMILMLYVSSYLFLITVLILLIYFLIVYLYNRTIKNYIIANQENEAIVSSSFVETIKGINTIKNLCIEGQMYDKVIDKYHNLVNNNYMFSKKYNFVKTIKDFISNGGILLIMFMSSLFILDGSLSVGNFILFNFLLSFFLEPMKNIFDLEPLLKASSNALIRISEFYNIEKDDLLDTKDVFKGDISLKDLSFTYNGQEKVINSLNLNIKSGNKIMINGPSGCGKSTIAKMLMRYLDIQRTQIMIDGKDTLDYALATIRNNICYVSQDELIFNDSLINNVSLNRDIPINDINKVLDITCINEIMERHQMDVYMLLEENGANLSGGEKQRIMIARALLKKSQIFIFDESMSEMNVTLERKILTNIFTNYNDKTIIVISHRLDNADLYDKIITVNSALKLTKEGVAI